jgi:CrcB protein
VVAGGAAGTAARVGLGDALPADIGAWPWATLLVNLAGALVLAYVVSRVLSAGAPAPLTIAMVGIGLLGALTTFSTLTLEVWRLGETGHAGTAVAYAAASLAGGLVAAFGGTRLAVRR